MIEPLILSPDMLSMITQTPEARQLRARLSAESTTDAEHRLLSDFYRRYQAARNRAFSIADFDLGRRLANSLPACVPSSEIPVWGLIVETRCHENLAFVVEQVTQRLNIPVQLVHGKANADFIRNGPLAPLLHDGRLLLSEMDDSCGLNAAAYNGLFMTSRFWQHLAGRRKILVFQTDSILCKNSDYTLGDFLHLDYVGSAWGREHTSKILFSGGNGGLSLRDWERTVACLERFDPAQWPSSEDKYFAFHLDFMGAKVASAHEAACFGSEHWFLYRSFGAHQLRVMLPTHLAWFLRYCPDGQRISDGRRPDRNLYRQCRAWISRNLLRLRLGKKRSPVG